MEFVQLIPLTQCRKGGGTFVECNGCELAVFRLENPERVIVIDNACPHAGGNLSGGELTDNIIACRLHHWAFNLDSGVCTHSDRIRVRRYPAEVRDGIVWADLHA